jgi:hypothetical protein
VGYDKISINAGSFGTYAAQIYMRRHGEHARTAYLSSLVTLADRVPLYYARSAQEGLDQLFKNCEEDPACHEAYPHLREDFAALLKKTREQPVTNFCPASGDRRSNRDSFFGKSIRRCHSGNDVSQCTASSVPD